MDPFGSVSCLDLPLSELWAACGRKDGTKSKTKPDKANCTSMCVAVVKRGNAKLRRSLSNIHLLYWRVQSTLVYYSVHQVEAWRALSSPFPDLVDQTRKAADNTGGQKPRTKEIESEKKYHSSIKLPLTNRFLTKFRSASFFSSGDNFFSRTNRLSSNVFFLLFFCFRTRSLPVRPISSSSCISSSLELSPPELSLLDPDSPSRAGASPYSFGSSKKVEEGFVRRECDIGLPGDGSPAWLWPPMEFMRLLLRRR